jgi:hypothetical protein
MAGYKLNQEEILMSKTTLAQLAPLAAFLFTDDEGKYAQALDVHNDTIDFQLDSGVTFTVNTDQVPFKVKPGYNVYFNSDFEAIAFDVPKQPAVETAPAKKTQGSGSTQAKQQRC